MLLIMAAFSRYDEALDWAGARAVQHWGPLALASPRFNFTETRFYEATMGTALRKCFFAFEHLFDPARLADVKLQTNLWEQEYAAVSRMPEPRPLNLDPGYLTEAKLVLASTKDRDHRIYLSRGIFAEGTLYFHGRRWRAREWTYPDYRSAGYHQFFDRCRSYLRQRYRQTWEDSDPEEHAV